MPIAIEMSEKGSISTNQGSVYDMCGLSPVDRPKATLSLVYFGAFLAYGASATILGAALPSLASDFHESRSAFGAAFTSRGMGYMFGTILSAFILQTKSLTNFKPLLTSLALLITGLATLLITTNTNFPAVIVCFFIQGIGFGGIDTIGNCGLPEMWGRRVQPWMQAMHSFFGIGGVVGPAFVGGLGYIAAFRIVAIISCLPLVSLFIPSLIKLVVGNSLNGNNGSNSSPSSSAGATWQNLSDVEEVIELSVMHSTSSTNDKTSKDENITKDEQPSAVDEDAATLIAPLFVKLIVVAFFFIYVGAETGYAGWVPTYALLSEVTVDKSAAAYLSAIFWAALTIGRIIAVPLAVFISASSMIRIQLTLAIIASILTATIFTYSYSTAAFTTGFVGFALSSMFPVMMTIFGDYGFAMDPNTTSMFMIGSTLGESIVPIIIGFALSYAGPVSFPIQSVVFSVILVMLYVGADVFGKKEAQRITSATLSSTSQHPLHEQLPQTESEFDEIEL